MDSDRGEKPARNDGTLITELRVRAMDPATRTDIKVKPQAALSPPATLDMILATEARLGLTLHPLLRQIYLEIANGGFGPGYGLLSLGPDRESDPGKSFESTYEVFRTGTWPEKLLPLWDWGDAIWSRLDSSTPDGVIVTHDGVDGATETTFVLSTWLGAWASGIDLWKEIYEDPDAVLTNPFTKRPVLTKVRGAAKGKKR